MSNHEYYPQCKCKFEKKKINETKIYSKSNILVLQ